jgi:hypothetical protein
MLMNFLSIASFAISAGGLYSLIKGKIKKDIVFAIIAAVLVTTSFAAIIELWMRYRQINIVQSEIISELSNQSLTFDQIYQELLFRPFNEVNEALFRGVEEKKIGHRILEFNNEGEMVSVRVYFVISGK